MCVYHTSKSVMDETAHLFLGFDLTRLGDRPEPDDTESFQVRPYRFEEVLGMVDAGEIVDSMTIIAMLQGPSGAGPATDSRSGRAATTAVAYCSAPCKEHGRPPCATLPPVPVTRKEHVHGGLLP